MDEGYKDAKERGDGVTNRGRNTYMKEGKQRISPGGPYEEDDRGKQIHQLDGPGDQDVSLGGEEARGIYFCSR